MTEHYWRWCEMCDANVAICGTCGNNTCNGGYGMDGKCPDCPSAYDLNKEEGYKHNPQWMAGDGDDSGSL